MKDTNLLFVYGTLKNESNHEMAKYLRANANYVGAGRINAKLYLVSWYPAIKLTGNNNDYVHGDLFEVEDTHVWSKIDIFEDCQENNPNSLYSKRCVSCELNNGETKNAWVYEYNPSISALEEIPNGVFDITS